MRVPSSSLTLRSGAPVRTRRGSGFEPLISRAVRGGAWAALSLRLRPSRGLGELVLEALVSSTAWHGFLWYLSCFRWAPGRPSHACASFRGLISFRARGSRRSRVLRGMGARGARFASDGPRGDLLTPMSLRGLISFRGRGPCRSRVLRGMGARGARFASNGPRGDLLTPMSLRGLTPSRARGSHRSRVRRGMGARDACFVSSGPCGDLLTLVPLRGLNLSRARSPCRSRVLLALQGTGPLNAPQ
jgi:hypothetical protein